MLQTADRLDVERVRADFPILRQQVHGKPLVYLDSAATAQKPEAVIRALDAYYREYNANVHRGVYEISERATARMEAARAALARFINAPSPRQVIFTRNTTEAINLVAYSWGRRNVGPGDVILTSELEHHSNLVPWQALAQETGARLEFIPVDDVGRLRLEALDALLDERVKLVAVTHVSNALGTIVPVAEIIRRAHAVGAVVLVDGAQSVPHLPVDVRALDCDFLAFSGHKMAGPMGVGALYGRRALLEAMPPFLYGGSMIRKVGLRESTWADLPAKFEAGTPSAGEAIGLGVAVDYLTGVGMANIRQHECDLIDYALPRLAAVPGVTLYGPPAGDDRAGVISFTLDGVHPHDLASILDSEGIAVRAGHHCCQPLMARYDLVATARASFYLYTTEGEIDALIAALHTAREVFQV
jgi:cysteine desulfurase/selenocysteine lyase